MKAYKLILLLLGIVVFNACEDDSFDPVVDPSGPPVLTSPTSTDGLVITEDNQGEALNLTWTAADFGFQAAVSYYVEMDFEGNDFSEAILLGSSNSLELEGLTLNDVNTQFLLSGKPANVPGNVEYRVCAHVNPNVDTLCSTATLVNYTPFETIIEATFLQVPGSYQGWDPASDQTMVYSRQADDEYEGFIYFNIDNALYKYAQGFSWDTNWGDNEPDGILDPAGFGNDIPIDGEAGMYLLRASLNDLAHSSEKTDWGVLGDATPTGWDADTDMVWDDANGVLSVTLDLVPGNIKFRANDDWAINFGDNAADGSLEFGGADIPVAEAGNYTIELIINVEKYTYNLTKN